MTQERTSTTGSLHGFQLVRDVLARVLDAAADEAQLEREREQLLTEVREREMIDATERDLAEAQRRLDVFRSQIPTRYRAASLANWQLHGSGADRKIQSRVQNAAIAYAALFGDRENAAAYFPQVVGFKGNVGTGKNHIAYSIIAEAHVAHGATFTVVRCQDLVRDIRGAWATSTRDAGDEQSSEAQRVARYRSVGILVIDEVSRDKLTVTEPSRHLYDVVAFREEWMRPTILITNEREEKDFWKLIGDSLADRLKGSSDLWQFGDRSYRPNLRRPPNVTLGGEQ